MTTIAIKRSIL